MQLQKQLTNYTQLYESNKSRKSIEFQAFQDLLSLKRRHHEVEKTEEILWGKILKGISISLLSSYRAQDIF